MRDVVDASTGALDYSPYGQVQQQLESVSPRCHYGQLLWDGNAGLSVTATHFYDASVARWMSRDPIEEEDGINLYAYVGASPTMGVDPSGLCLEDACILEMMAAACAANPIACSAAAIGAAGNVGSWWNNAFPPSTPVPAQIFPMGKSRPRPRPEDKDDDCDILSSPDTKGKAKKSKDPNRGKGGRFRNGSDNLDQYLDVENSQGAVRQGKSQSQIDSIEKSKQRFNNGKKNLKTLEEIQEYYE